MKVKKLFSRKPVDKTEFNHSLASVNSKRAFVAAILILVLKTIMLSVHWDSANFHYNPAMRLRSSYMVSYAQVELLISIICTSVYFFSLRKKTSVSFRLTAAYLIYLTIIVYGVSVNLMMFLLDGALFFNFYILFTMFACLLFLLKPFIRLVSLVVVALFSVWCYHFLPIILDLPGLDVYSRSVFIETVMGVVIISVTISTILYRNYIGDFNKTYTIELLNKELSWYIKIDALTNLFNRKEFIRLLIEKNEEMALEGSWLSVAIIDIDYFKQYNDTYGHLEGDKCLRDVAECLKNSICHMIPEAIVARYGGEEFTTMISGREPKVVSGVFEKALADIRALNIEHESSPITPIITISLGVYSVKPTEGYDVSEALRYADKLLYQAKDSGRNCMVAEFYKKK